MPRRLDARQPDFAGAFATLLSEKREAAVDVRDAVAAILADVRLRGDAALIDYTRRFDRLDLMPAGLAIAAVPVSFYIAGLIHHDSYTSNTALLAGQAVFDAEIVTIAIKDIDRRMPPREVGPNGNFSDTWFRTQNRGGGGFGSFPSGHTAGPAMTLPFGVRCRVVAGSQPKLVIEESAVD